MQTVLDDLDALLATFEAELGRLDDAALDLVPADGGWSARQTIGHLVLTARLYEERMRAAIDGRPGGGDPHAGPRKSSWFARMLLRWLPDAARRFKAPAPFDPRRADERFDVDALLATYRAVRETGLRARDLHLGTLRIGTPVSRLLRMSIRDAVAVQVAHAERHLDQIRRAAQGREGSGAA